MEDKYFTVTLEIKAPNADYIEKMLDRMPQADRIFNYKIVDPDTPRLESRIRYVEDWGGRGEHFLVENKWSNEEHWGLDTGFPLISFENGEKVVGKGDYLHYTALTKLRELKRLGIPFYFSGEE